MELAELAERAELAVGMHSDEVNVQLELDHVQLKDYASLHLQLNGFVVGKAVALNWNGFAIMSNAKIAKVKVVLIKWANQIL